MEDLVPISYARAIERAQESLQAVMSLPDDSEIPVGEMAMLMVATAQVYATLAVAKMFNQGAR